MQRGTASSRLSLVNGPDARVGRELVLPGYHNLPHLSGGGMGSSRRPEPGSATSDGYVSGLACTALFRYAVEEHPSGSRAPAIEYGSRTRRDRAEAGPASRRLDGWPQASAWRAWRPDACWGAATAASSYPGGVRPIRNSHSLADKVGDRAIEPTLAARPVVRTFPEPVGMRL